MDYYKESLKLHEELQGKMETKARTSVSTKDDLSIAYTPGVAEPCREISKNPDDVYKYTNKSNTVAVLSDGSAVLGLGNIGAAASIPVMDGKSLLFKEFAGIDAIPICVDTQDVDEIVMIGKNIAPTLGGINLEDISAPRCFEIEKKLQAEVDIPVFHDDQHGTAVVVSAAVINSMRITGRKTENLKAVINGGGSAGTAIAKMLLNIGIKDIVVCDKFGAISSDMPELSDAHKDLAAITNPGKVKGSLADVMKGRDIFIGVSAPRLVNEEMVKSMNDDPIIFSMANPEPEIKPEIALSAGAKIVGTGRSDYPNQINNVLAFPGIFKGALQVRAKRITEEMKVAAAYALADFVPAEKLNEKYILPNAFEEGIADAIADAVGKAWKE